MDVAEFRKIKPEYKEVEGDDLWDAMTDYMLRCQRANETIKQIKPFWKTHTFRWLFYRHKPNWSMGSPKADWYKADSRCKECKKGVGARIIWMVSDEVRQSNPNFITSPCPHCKKQYVGEPNTNISHKIYSTLHWVKESFFFIMDKFHIIRNQVGGRYDMMGDEARYIHSVGYFENKTVVNLKKRKWWEYIVIEKTWNNF